MPTPTSPAACSAAAVRAVSTRSSSTKSRSRRTSPRYQYSMMLGSVFEIEATARPGPHAAGARDGHQRGARRCCARRARPAAEVERARNVLETQIFSGLQLVGGFGGVADQLNLYNHYLGTPDYLDEGHRAPAPERDARVRAPVRAAVPRARTRASSSTAFLESRTSAGSAEACRTGRHAGAPTVSINADEPWRDEAAGGVGRARGARARAAVVPACRTG